MTSGERDFEGKAAIVTGACGGIGAATARLFARRGASLILADIDSRGLARVSADVAESSSCESVGRPS